MVLTEIRIHLLNPTFNGLNIKYPVKTSLRMWMSLQAQMLFLVLIVTRDVASKEKGWELWSIQEQIQWRLLGRRKEILNIIPLKLGVVWRKTVGHSVYTIHIAWKIPLHSECFYGKRICFFNMHFFFGQSYLTLQRLSWAFVCTLILIIWI